MEFAFLSITFKGGRPSFSEGVHFLRGGGNGGFP